MTTRGYNWWLAMVWFIWHCLHNLPTLPVTLTLQLLKRDLSLNHKQRVIFQMGCVVEGAWAYPSLGTGNMTLVSSHQFNMHTNGARTVISRDWQVLLPYMLMCAAFA